MNSTFSPGLWRSARLFAAAFLWLTLVSPVVLAAGSVVDELNTLIAQEDYQQAYVLAQENLRENEGDPEFDFFYGLAALETGRPDEAVFAFERVAFSYPDQRRVKLELARAYFMSNNLAAAENLFNEVLATEPAPNVTANINAFLEAIDERRSRVQPSVDWFLTSNVGSDSNINSATELGVISTPIGDVELSAGGQSIDDNFTDLGGGFTLNLPLSKTRGFTVRGNYNQHNNLDTSQFDLETLSLEGAYGVTMENNRLNGALRTRRVLLDDSGFQTSASLLGIWQRSGGNGWSQGLTGAFTAVRYDNTTANPNNDLRDVNQVLISGVLGRTMGNFVHNLSVYFGDEYSLSERGENNAQQFYGVALSEQYRLSPAHVPFLRLSLHQSDNKALDPVFNIEREDETFSATVGWIWQFNRNLNINTDVTYTENDSNIQLYEYDRLKYQTGIRYQF